MAEPIIITAIKTTGIENAYIGTIGDDGYVYFNDAMFYRFKPTGTWEQNVYVLNRSRGGNQVGYCCCRGCIPWI